MQKHNINLQICMNMGFVQMEQGQMKNKPSIGIVP